MDTIALKELCAAQEKQIQSLMAELNFADLEEPSRLHRRNMEGMLDCIRTNFAEHSDYTPSVTQMTRTRALVTLFPVDSGDVLVFVLQTEEPKRMLTILAFVWAVFMERWSEKVRDIFYDSEFAAFCAQMVRYTEGADYDSSCRVFVEGE